MSLSISSSDSGAGSAVASAPKPFILDAEKARCVGQLSDTVNCASATTPAGKAKIEELSAQLSSINAKIEEAGTSNTDVTSRGPQVPTGIAASSAVNANHPAATAQVSKSADDLKSPRTTTPTATLGNAVNVFA